MNVTWTDDMGEVLQAAREDLGWSRQRLAAEAGVSERTIIDLENNARPGRAGAVNPRRSTVINVVRAAGDQDLAALAEVRLPERPVARQPGDDEIVSVLVKHLLPAVEELKHLFADSE